MPEMSAARALMAASARELARRISEAGPAPPLTVRRTVGRVVCLVQVWDAAAEPPVAGGEVRCACRAAILVAVREAGRPLTRRQVTAALRREHGPGTVAKALADLTRDHELVNPRDRRGYRLPEQWRRSQTPSLFDPDSDTL